MRMAFSLAYIHRPRRSCSRVRYSLDLSYRQWQVPAIYVHVYDNLFSPILKRTAVVDYYSILCGIVRGAHYSICVHNSSCRRGDGRGGWNQMNEWLAKDQLELRTIQGSQCLLIPFFPAATGYIYRRRSCHHRCVKTRSTYRDSSYQTRDLSS